MRGDGALIVGLTAVGIILLCVILVLARSVDDE